MSVLLLAHRKAECQKKKKIFRKVGVLDKSGEPKLTHSWTVCVDGKQTTIAFSRDNMYVLVDGEQVQCTAYITDKGFDLDLKFNIQSNNVHIYSDVEGHKMTNYLFLNDELVETESRKM
ncbi:hypothetical protein SNE40_000818 [Patella caerulea]|uniref:Uncharacterized protein n=1 Tax=Patella caerulea TaxID=87958 RepID=A0AAN8Q256_PATCE